LKTKHTIKPRNRLAGQIAKAAHANPDAARELAFYGEHLTEEEKAVYVYLKLHKTIWQHEFIKKNDPDGAKQTLAQLESTATLWKLFFDSVNRLDGDALRAMASELERYKRKNYEGKSVRGDSLRRDILSLKQKMEQSGHTISVKYLAKLLNAMTPVRVPATDDGYSQLRRLAKGLNFRLAKGTRGRPKRPTNKAGSRA
jgi:hypothetical protein